MLSNLPVLLSCQISHACTVLVWIWVRVIKCASDVAFVVVVQDILHDFFVRYAWMQTNPPRNDRKYHMRYTKLLLNGMCLAFNFLLPFSKFSSYPKDDATL
jgi:hypothetical protein